MVYNQQCYAKKCKRYVAVKRLFNNLQEYMGTQHAIIPSYDAQDNQYIHLVVVNVFGDCTKSFYQLIM